MANDLVVKSNTLINASYSLTLAEQRLIGLAIVKANNQHKKLIPTLCLLSPQRNMLICSKLTEQRLTWL